MSTKVEISLADHWQRYLAGLVADRRYESVDQAVEEGLRLLEADNDKHDRLLRMLEAGEQSGDAGPWDLAEFLDEQHRREEGREAA